MHLVTNRSLRQCTKIIFHKKRKEMTSKAATLEVELIDEMSHVITRGASYDDFSGQFFRIFEIIIFCFVDAI